MTEIRRPVLKGTKALVIGIANEHSIAYGCARAFRELGAEAQKRLSEVEQLFGASAPAQKKIPKGGSLT